MEHIIFVKFGYFVGSIGIVILIGLKKAVCDVKKKQDPVVWNFFDIALVIIVNDLLFSIVPDLLVYYKFVYPSIVVWLCALIMPSLTTLVILWCILNYKYHIKMNKTLKIIGENSRNNLFFGLQWGIFISFLWVLDLYYCVDLSANRIQQVSSVLLSNAPWGFLTKSLWGIILCPIAEEVLYRGFIYRAFRQKLRAKQAMFWSAVTWAIGHESGFLLNTLIGYILAKVYDQQKSLIPCIIIHACINIVVYLCILHFYYHAKGVIVVSRDNFYMMLGGVMLLIFWGITRIRSRSKTSE